MNGVTGCCTPIFPHGAILCRYRCKQHRQFVDWAGKKERQFLFRACSRLPSVKQNGDDPDNFFFFLVKKDIKRKKEGIEESHLEGKRQDIHLE